MQEHRPSFLILVCDLMGKVGLIKGMVGEEMLPGTGAGEEEFMARIQNRGQMRLFREGRCQDMILSWVQLGYWGL